MRSQTARQQGGPSLHALAPAPFLPYGRQSIDEADIAAVAAVLRSDHLTTGPAIPAFEQALARAVQAPHAIACANGTAALHLVLLALGVRAGDAVIAPAITFAATANAARFVGADVVFADVDPDTALMRPDTLRAALARAGKRPVRAVMAVHYGGACAPVAELAAIARGVGAHLVEDACHALGARHAGGVVGDCRHSAAAVFSFHPVKTIATGEGGMVTTTDPDLARRLALFRSHGIVREPGAFEDAALSRDVDGEAAPWAYELQMLGYNYRLSDIHAALGLSQLGKLERFVAARRALRQAYARALPRGVALAPMPEGAGPHLCVALIDFQAADITRAQVMAALKAEGIGTQVHYIPLHRQPYYRALYGPLDLPGAERFYARCLSLPLFPDMTEDDVSRVCDALGRVLR